MRVKRDSTKFGQGDRQQPADCSSWHQGDRRRTGVVLAGVFHLLLCLSMASPGQAQRNPGAPNSSSTPASPAERPSESLPFDVVPSPANPSSPANPDANPSTGLPTGASSPGSPSPGSPSPGSPSPGASPTGTSPTGAIAYPPDPLEAPVVPAAPDEPIPDPAAEPDPQDEVEGFPPNPLEEPIVDDPLLPRLVVDRPLSPQERSILSAALDELQRQAAAKLQAGDAPGAFDIWNRELRLRRVLGASEEVKSLSLVGEVAWRENQVTEVRIITQRLQQIQIEVASKTPVNYDLLLEIAQAYQNMRAIAPAVGLYEQILVQARQQQNRTLEETTLVDLGNLHLAWFDFTSAAPVYQDLLRLARQQGDRIKEIDALKQLAYIYTQNNQPEQAIATQRQLVSVYESQRQYVEIAPIKMAIGDQYLVMNRPDLAAPSYQEAFAIARSGQQYGYAGDALQRLADLYRSLNRLDDALVVYQLLLDVRQQTYDTVGIMQVYDQMGQVYRTRGNTPQAIAVFRRGLQLAEQLNYANKVSYFTSQIQAASQPPAQQ
jgi:tetratricopeptide (TPR) repeat protein